MSQPKRVFRKTERGPEQEAEIRAIRERYQSRPGVDELIESGDVDPASITSLGEYGELLDALRILRAERERLGLSLAKVAERSGLEETFLAKLENGHSPNPALGTLTHYAEAVGIKLTLSLQRTAS